MFQSGSKWQSGGNVFEAIALYKSSCSTALKKERKLQGSWESYIYLQEMIDFCGKLVFGQYTLVAWILWVNMKPTQTMH